MTFYLHYPVYVLGEKAGMRHTKLLAVLELLDVAIMGFYSDFSKFPT